MTKVKTLAALLGGRPIAGWIADIVDDDQQSELLQFHGNDSHATMSEGLLASLHVSSDDRRHSMSCCLLFPQYIHIDLRENTQRLFFEERTVQVGIAGQTDVPDWISYSVPEDVPDK